MTTTSVRGLAYWQTEYVPSHGDGIETAMATIEHLLRLAHDYDEPAIVAAIPALTNAPPAVVEHLIEELYCLADQVAEAGRFVAGGADEWQAPRALCVSEYEDALRRLATVVRGAA